jgi:hypothetical protein
MKSCQRNRFAHATQVARSLRYTGAVRHALEGGGTGQDDHLHLGTSRQQLMDV